MGLALKKLYLAAAVVIWASLSSAPALCAASSEPGNGEAIAVVAYKTAADGASKDAKESAFRSAEAKARMIADSVGASILYVYTSAEDKSGELTALFYSVDMTSEELAAALRKVPGISSASALPANDAVPPGPST